MTNILPIAIGSVLVPLPSSISHSYKSGVRDATEIRGFSYPLTRLLYDALVKAMGDGTVFEKDSTEGPGGLRAVAEEYASIIRHLAEQIRSKHGISGCADGRISSPHILQKLLKEAGGLLQVFESNAEQNTTVTT